MNKAKLAALLPVAAFAMPLLASAQQLQNVSDIFTAIGGIVALLLPILVGVALLAFFWGLAKFIFAAGDEGKRSEGKQIMLWGIIALFVIVSIWGIVLFINDALGIEQGETITVPKVPGI